MENKRRNKGRVRDEWNKMRWCVLGEVSACPSIEMASPRGITVSRLGGGSTKERCRVILDHHLRDPWRRNLGVL